jgi:hypothetical protein
MVHTWGEVEVIKLKTKTSPQMLNPGINCIFVGCYPANHSSKCVKMWDAVKESYHATRDVAWLHRMFYKNPKKVQQEIEMGEGT